MLTIFGHSCKKNCIHHFLQFDEAVDKIPLMGSTTRIDRALRMTQNEMFTTANGGRAGVPNILILLTDGTQTQVSTVKKLL